MRKHKYMGLFGVTNGIICQQVNCKGAYGAGLSWVIADKYPIVRSTYMKTYREYGDSKLGSFDIIDVDSRIVEPTIHNPSGIETLSVANIYSQYDYGNPSVTGKVYTNLPMLVRAIGAISTMYPNRVIYIPHSVDKNGKHSGIGCGLGGEKWENVYENLKALELENILLLDTWTGEATRLGSLDMTPKEDSLIGYITGYDDLDTPEKIEHYNDMLTEDMTVNYTICEKCRGKCCKTVPCALTPKQIASLGYELTEESLTECLESGKYSLDYWYDEDDDVDIPFDYFIRYRSIGAPIADEYYDGAECIMLSDKGCTLPFDKRGADGRSLIPSKMNRCHGLIGKKEMAIVWRPYGDILRKLWDKYYSESR